MVCPDICISRCWWSPGIWGKMQRDDHILCHCRIWRLEAVAKTDLRSYWHKPLEAWMKRRHFKHAAIPALFMLTQKSVYISEVLTGHTSEAFFPKQAPEHEASAAEKCWITVWADATINTSEASEIQTCAVSSCPFWWTLAKQLPPILGKEALTAELLPGTGGMRSSTSREGFLWEVRLSLGLSITYFHFRWLTALDLKEALVSASTET